MSNSKALSREDRILFKELSLAESLRESYFKHSWVLTSILLPVAFGLVGLSFSEPLLNLDWFELLPLMLTSVLLGCIWFRYVGRYAGYLQSIYNRFKDIEKDLGMNLHSRIDVDDPKKYHRLVWVNTAAIASLVVVWGLRLYVAPIQIGFFL